MKLLVEIDERKWQSVQDGTWCGSEEIARGQPIPDDCEILTREAYEDLCARASGLRGDTDGNTIFD